MGFLKGFPVGMAQGMFRVAMIIDSAYELGFSLLCFGECNCVFLGGMI